jgi:hypothetical protein
MKDPYFFTPMLWLFEFGEIFPEPWFVILYVFWVPIIFKLLNKFPTIGWAFLETLVYLFFWAISKFIGVKTWP